MRKSIFAVAMVSALLLAAGTAQAAKFVADEYTAQIKGVQTGTGATGEGTILGFESKLMTECGTAGYTGELTAASSTLSVVSGPGGCLAFGFSNAEIRANGCGYLFHVASGAGDEFGGTMDVVCPAGKTIEIVGGTCEVRIGAQVGLGSVSYENRTKATPKQAVRVKFNVTGLAYTITKDGFACSFSATGPRTDGGVYGEVETTATHSGTAVGLRIE